METPEGGPGGSVLRCLAATLVLGLAVGLQGLFTTAAFAASRATASGSSFTATGYFRVAESQGRWWLVTPDGHSFYAAGIDHVSASPDVDQTTGQCPYCQAIATEYPSTAAWASATVRRLHGWGFNTLGPFTDDSTFSSQMPYEVQLSMASGDDWFAPSFVTNADQVAATQVAPLADDHNLIGYFTDSELHWGPDGSDPRPILDNYLALPAGSPGLAVAQQYQNNPNGFVFALATRYFQVTSAALHQYDPNHLDLGVKAESQEIQPELLEAARPYVDVWSIDEYQLAPGLAQAILKLWPQYLPVTPTLSDFEKYVQRPIMVGEYSFRADGGPGSPPNTVPVVYSTYANQAQRSNQYQAYVAPLYYSSPWVVGDDWFEYVDEPSGGRVPDGENDNFGTVTVADQAYQQLVSRMTLAHAAAPDRLAEPGSRCDSWAAGSGPGNVTCTATVDPDQLGPPGPGAGGGYWLDAADGGVFSFGNATYYGSMGGKHLNAPVVAMAATPDGRGYWLVGADGGIFAFGDAGYHGSMGGRPLTAPVVAMAATPDGGGYWLVGADGNVYPFGDATSFGSLAGQTLRQPIVGIASTLDSGGYWLVAKDGGVFAFGDAAYDGSTGALTLNRPVVAVVPSPDALGYWLITADGGVFAFGDAVYSGSMGGKALDQPVVAATSTPDGYRLGAADGGVLSFGGAQYLGSAGGHRLNAPVVGMAT
jgi:hypothetical protein